MESVAVRPLKLRKPVGSRRTSHFLCFTFSACAALRAVSNAPLIVFRWRAARHPIAPSNYPAAQGAPSSGSLPCSKPAHQTHPACRRGTLARSATLDDIAIHVTKNLARPCMYSLPNSKGRPDKGAARVYL